MKRFFIVCIALAFSCTAFAAKDKNRRLYQYQWYTIESIRDYVQANDPSSMGWIFPVGRKYILKGEGEHSSDLTKVNKVDPQLYKVGGGDFYNYRPDKPADLSQEIEKLCMSQFKKRLQWVGGRSGGFSHFKKYRYEVIGIESHELVLAPLDIYYSKQRPTINKVPNVKNSILCSVYKSPMRNGSTSYQAVVILSAEAAYSNAVK